MKRILLVFLIVLCAVAVFADLSWKNANCGQEAVVCNADTLCAFEEYDNEIIALTGKEQTVIDKIGSVLFGKEESMSSKVYLGGTPVGLSLDSRGVKVIGISEVLTQEGIRTPAIEADIRIGDVILRLNGKDIVSVSALSRLTAESNGDEIIVEILRNGEVLKKAVKPRLDVTDNRYKLGIWAKEGSSGIGTLTYVKENGEFGSLGHPIVNPETGDIYKISGGTVYNCTISGIVKGVRGRAGELRGSFINEVIGEISINNEYGVYGTLDKSSYEGLKQVEVAKAKSVKPGKAQIYSTISDKGARMYDIEIIKASKQNEVDDKGMVIRIIDKELIEQTGGIVQGMSGSPIIQDGKLVGAVTHVFVNDPLKGYGIYAEWMLSQ